MTFTLPISPEYVSHWSLWEAVREIYQNALDERTLDESCGASITYDSERQILSIATTKGKLARETLVLGKTTKAANPKLRGKFGEGYKLALLVLARLKHEVIILNASETWTPYIGVDENFGCDVLQVMVMPDGPGGGVEFKIGSVEPDDWTAIQANILEWATERTTILGEPGQEGRIYVGGLFVSHVKDFKCGYTFAPGTIKLDRDRGMIDGFDLAWQTSSLWNARGGSRMTDLVNAEAPDVKYITSHATASSRGVSSLFGWYSKTHGDAVPVSDQDEIERATKAGVKWVLVPESVKSMLRLVKNWIIPSTSENPAEMLLAFSQKYRSYITAEMRKDIEDILKVMDRA